MRTSTIRTLIVSALLATLALVSCNEKIEPQPEPQPEIKKEWEEVKIFRTIYGAPSSSGGVITESKGYKVFNAKEGTDSIRIRFSTHPVLPEYKDKYPEGISYLALPREAMKYWENRDTGFTVTFEGEYQIYNIGIPAVLEVGLPEETECYCFDDRVLELDFTLSSNYDIRIDKTHDTEEATLDINKDGTSGRLTVKAKRVPSTVHVTLGNGGVQSTHKIKFVGYHYLTLTGFPEEGEMIGYGDKQEVTLGIDSSLGEDVLQGMSIETDATWIATSKEDSTITFKIDRNPGPGPRAASILIGGTPLPPQKHVITQGYSEKTADGEIQIMRHTKGNGIAFGIHIGSSFEEGREMELANKVADAIINIEPMRSFGDFFDFYVYEDKWKLLEDQDERIPIFLINGPGTSNVMFKVVTIYCQHGIFYEDTVQHEIGHRLGDLCDEYERESSEYEIYDKNSIGYHPNISATNDPERVPWSAFLKLDDYKDKVGIYEGGAFYRKGIWRPSENSIMRYQNKPDGLTFNAPSRYALFCAIMSLSGEHPNWGPNYSGESFRAFLEYDKINL